MSSTSSSRSSSPSKSNKASLNSSTDSFKPSIESLASLLIRSLLVLFLLLTSLLLALVAWFSLKSFLKVDPIIGRERVWLQYGEFRPPYAYVELEKGRYGAPGESYDLSLELIVPSSKQNLATGNFMVSLSLLNGENETILNNSRPAILTHPIYPRLSHVLPLRPIPPPTQSLHIPLLESVPLNRGSSSRSSKKVERIFVEVGRRDAHSPYPSLSANGGSVGLYEGGGEGQVVQRGSGAGELQVYESYLKIQVKLYGLRALIRSHPYLSFLFFFPTFLLTELLAALAVYAYFVLRPADEQSEEGSLKGIKREFEDEVEEVEDKVKEQAEEIKREIKDEEEEEEETTSEPPSGVSETEEEELLKGAERFRMERRRERLAREAGPGGKGMSEIQGESLTETEETEETEEEESGEGSEEWEGVVGPGEETEMREKDFDETATIGGSETTRATRSTFGPSVAGTSSTRTTATSASTRGTEGLRERQGRGGVEE